MADPTQVRAPDFGYALDAYSQGTANRSRLAEMAARDEDRQFQRQQRSSLMEIGAQAAGGDLAGARDTAYRSGNLDAGQKFDAARIQGEARELNEIAGAITSADTPQKFAAALTSIEQRKGLAPGSLTSKHRFENREAILGEVLGAKEQAELAIRKVAATNKETPDGYQRTPDGGLRIIPGGPADPNSQAAARAAAAKTQGLDTTSGPGQAYVLTGRMPREDQQPLTATDKKAILEADEAISSTQIGIDALKQAKVLSPKALSGPYAGQRGYVGSLAGHEASVATADLDNLITSQALANLKATFGAAPTEGERKILLEIQGSVSQPDEVRQKIYDRAIAMAERRNEFNRKRADELRGGTYYKPPGSQPAAKPPQSPGATPAPAAPAHLVSQLPPGVTADQARDQAKAALAAGKDRNGVLAKLQGWGVDTSGL